jgi:hypothetical protein
LRYSEIDWRLLLLAAVALCVAVALGVRHLFFRKPDDPEEEERRRRSHLNQVGRIVEGYVVEIVEALGTPAAGSGSGPLSPRKTTASSARDENARRLVRYSYSISGITYETAQDVTGLEERLCLERLAAGQPASVKYDPSNPSNSILVADDWSGIK